MDAQQELFIKLKTRIEQQGIEVYDGALPPEDVPYPFVYMGFTQQVDQGDKSGGVRGRISQMIHVYHNDVRRRGSLSSILTIIKAICRSIVSTPGYTWNCTTIDEQILPDNTTAQPLIHGIITADYIY